MNDSTIYENIKRLCDTVIGAGMVKTVADAEGLSLLLRSLQQRLNLQTSVSDASSNT